MKGLIIPALVMVTACSSSRNSSGFSREERSPDYYYSQLWCTAWSEDTVINYRIAIFKDHNFWYTTEEPGNRQKVVTGYHGKYRISNDTTYLSFQGKEQPPMCDYLIREPSGLYLVQFFKDRRRRMFLRVTGNPSSGCRIYFGYRYPYLRR